MLITLITAACQRKDDHNQPDFLAKNIDSTANPGEDFFKYAEGNWLKNNKIPDEESGWGIGNLVKEEIYNRLRTINEQAREKKANQGVEQQIGDFWYSAMDTLSLEKQGLKPLQADLAQINRISTINELMHLAAIFHTRRTRVLFSDYVGQDDKNSEVYAYYLIQGGLGLPDRDYYFNTDLQTQAVRQAYLTYLAQTFRQLGNDSLKAVKMASSVYNLEKRLATSSRKLAALRDPYKNYHKMSLADLSKIASGVDWSAFFKQVSAPKIDSVIVGQPEFFTTLSNELHHTPIEDWKNYLRFHLLKHNADFLDQKTFQHAFAYRSALRGTKFPKPRWKRVIDAEEQAMGEALGQLFVEEYFPEKAKKRYVDLVENIRDAYRDRINALTWMSDSTKQKAVDKLKKITKKVGYPDKWKDFSALRIDRGPYVLNMQRADQWWYTYMITKLGKPVDRTEWGMNPQEWNAYYNPSNNEIVLPAGIFMVPGVKDEELDDAFIYGYVGASTVGHEMTHGFDDQGRQYDEKGNLRDWWTARDGKQFSQRARKIIQQFNEFTPVDTLHINGDATQGENIADLGGVLLGLDAFKKTDSYKEGKLIGGLTPLQRYFLGYAYSWMFQQRKEVLANQLMTDVHSPAKERVNGPLVNIPEFYEAFHITKSDKMYRPDSLQVRIW